MLIPAERLIFVNASEAMSGDDPNSPPPLHDRPRARPLDLPRRTARAAPTYCRSQDVVAGRRPTLEREANIFAAELLMPEDAVREAWAACPQRNELASRFGVSALAAQWRLYSFGLVQERPVLSVWRFRFRYRECAAAADNLVMRPTVGRVRAVSRIVFSPWFAAARLVGHGRKGGACAR